MSAEVTDLFGSFDVNNRKKSDGGVQSIIFLYERLVMLKKMGAEQSTNGIKLEHGSGLVRQRVNQFDCCLNSDKKNAQNAVIENNEYRLVRDFQRSKSLNWTGNEKNRYSRSRQVLPSQRLETSNNDSNNNSHKKIATIKRQGGALKKTWINQADKTVKEDACSKMQLKSVNNIKQVSEKKIQNTNTSHNKDLNLMNKNEERHCDKSSDINTKEEYRKSIINDIVEIAGNHTEDDFNQIESSFHEVEQTIKEIKKLRGCSDVEEPENIEIHVINPVARVGTDIFGQRMFSSNESIDFIEAYNRFGDELIVTSIAGIEYKSIVPESSTNDVFFLSSYAEDLDTRKSGSNQSSIYSSTNTNSTNSIDRCTSKSENSLIYEDIHIEKNVEFRHSSTGGLDRKYKTETIYDSYQNPRIAKLISDVISEKCPVKSPTILEDEIAFTEEFTDSKGLKSQKDYIVEELIETEEKYIQHLEKVVKDYIPIFVSEEIPTQLLGKHRYLFGNIKRIYTSTKKFYEALKNCNNDHEKVAQTFLNFKYLFELYPLYSKNKPASDQYLLGEFKEIIEARQKQLNDRLGLASNLLTPIQRLGKYILFLEQIQKEVLKTNGNISNDIKQAIGLVRKEMSRGNDYLAIDSIKDCPIRLLDQGSFVMREKFNIVKPRKYEAMLFLFENILIFTTVDPKNPELFIYKDNIPLNEMGIVTIDDQPHIFHLKRFPSHKKGPKEYHEFVIEAKKNKNKKAWTEQIEKRLWNQLVKCREEQQIELKERLGKRYSSSEIPDRVPRRKPGYSSLPNEIGKNLTKSIFYYNT